MLEIVEFEVCGLGYVLRLSPMSKGRVPTFQLCDEAFTETPSRFSARSRDELFAKIEMRIGMPLTVDARDQLRAVIARFGKTGALVEKMSRVITASAGPAQDLAVGIR